MTDCKTASETSEEYFAKHPEKIDAHLTGIFATYAKDADSAALLSQLRVVARVKGISAMAEEIGITRQGLQKALSGKGNPRLENVNAIMRSMGYLLTPQRIDAPSASQKSGPTFGRMAGSPRFKHGRTGKIASGIDSEQ